MDCYLRRDETFLPLKPEKDRKVVQLAKRLAAVCTICRLREIRHLLPTQYQLSSYMCSHRSEKRWSSLELVCIVRQSIRPNRSLE